MIPRHVLDSCRCCRLSKGACARHRYRRRFPDPTCNRASGSDVYVARQQCQEAGVRAPAFMSSSSSMYTSSMSAWKFHTKKNSNAGDRAFASCRDRGQQYASRGNQMVLVGDEGVYAARGAGDARGNYRIDIKASRCRGLDAKRHLVILEPH